MKFRWDKKYLQWGLTAFCVVAASMLFYFGIFHMDTLKQGLSKIYEILTPIIYAAIISYILWPIIRFMEKTVIYRLCELKKWNPTKKVRKVIRMFCVIVSLLLFFLLIYGLLSMLVPEIINSITNIVESFPRYINNIEHWMDDLLKNTPELATNSNMIFSKIFAQAESWLSNDLLPQINSVVKNFSSGFFGVLTFLKNFLIGAMISIYLLYGKETYVAHGKQFLYCIFRPETSNNIIRDLQFIDKTFGGFIVGKILDSIIIGILCYIGTVLLNLPYALLISVVVGVTNVIPFFGPYLGAVPSAFLILLVNPVQCIYFVLFILVLQQFDGNFLGPKILGGSTGLSSFMVIVAILVGGGLFGIVGMFIGVPACAVICTILRNLIRIRLEKKKLPADVKAYQDIDHLDAETLKPVYKTNQESNPKEAFSSYRKIRIHMPDIPHRSPFQKASPEEEQNAKTEDSSENPSKKESEQNKQP
ncbi:MAG: AI-2E family transporter [Clostridiales bacterium]|nr:AI-2E family transporter [Clostridiales bacterium]